MWAREFCFSPSLFVRIFAYISAKEKCLLFHFSGASCSAFSDEFHSEEMKSLHRRFVRGPLCAEPRRFNQPKRMFIITLKIPLVSFSIARPLSKIVLFRVHREKSVVNRVQRHRVVITRCGLLLFDVCCCWNIMVLGTPPEVRFVIFACWIW